MEEEKIEVTKSGLQDIISKAIRDNLPKPTESDGVDMNSYDNNPYSGQMYEDPNYTYGGGYEPPVQPQAPVVPSVTRDEFYRTLDGLRRENSNVASQLGIADFRDRLRQEISARRGFEKYYEPAMKIAEGIYKRGDRTDPVKTLAYLYGEDQLRSYQAPVMSASIGETDIPANSAPVEKSLGEMTADEIAEKYSSFRF